MLGLEHGLGLFVNSSLLSAQLAAELKFNANPYGFTVLTGRSSPAPLANTPKLAAGGSLLFPSWHLMAFANSNL